MGQGLYIQLMAFIFLVEHLLLIGWFIILLKNIYLNILIQ